MTHPAVSVNGHHPQPAKCHHYAVFRMSCEQFEQLKARAGGRCEICGVHEERLYRRKLSIDHSHTTGYIRGLLCPACNTVMSCLDGGKAWGANRVWEDRARAYRDLPAPWKTSGPDVPRCRVLHHHGGNAEDRPEGE